MQSIMSGSGRDDYIKNPINHSKGCGGIMRIAPLGLYYSNVDLSRLDMTGAKLSAITHGHSLGYMPSAVLTHILNRIVYPEKETVSLKEIIAEARDTAAEIFREDVHIGTLTGLINHAAELSENSLDDLENIKKLGAGWVAEETLAIAIYCSLKYRDDFSRV